MTTAHTFLTLIDNPFLLPAEASIVDDLFSLWGRCKELSFAQLDLLKGFIGRINVRKAKICPKCHGKIINHVGRVAGNNYKASKVCENTQKFVPVKRGGVVVSYDARCEYVEGEI